VIWKLFLAIPPLIVVRTFDLEQATIDSQVAIWKSAKVLKPFGQMFIEEDKRLEAELKK